VGLPHLPWFMHEAEAGAEGRSPVRSQNLRRNFRNFGGTLAPSRGGDVMGVRRCILDRRESVQSGLDHRPAILLRTNGLHEGDQPHDPARLVSCPPARRDVCGSSHTAASIICRYRESCSGLSNCPRYSQICFSGAPTPLVGRVIFGRKLGKIANQGKYPRSVSAAMGREFRGRGL
jgi:hypothetical protein